MIVCARFGTAMDVSWMGQRYIIVMIVAMKSKCFVVLQASAQSFKN